MKEKLTKGELESYLTKWEDYEMEVQKYITGLRKMLSSEALSSNPPSPPPKPPKH